MTILSLVGVGAWGLQIIFNIVVLALSVDLLKGQIQGNPPGTVQFAVLVGSVGLMVAVLGLVSMFVEKIPSHVVMAVDVVSGLLLVSGGIAYAIGLSGIKCNVKNFDEAIEAVEAWFKNPILNAGFDKDYEGNKIPDFRRCEKAYADQAMQFVAAITALGTAFICFLAWKRSAAGWRTSSPA